MSDDTRAEALQRFLEDHAGQDLNVMMDDDGVTFWAADGKSIRLTPEEFFISDPERAE